MPLRGLAALLVACALALPAGAHAQAAQTAQAEPSAAPLSPPATPRAPPNMLPPYPQLQYSPRQWFGWQILLADLGALGLGALAASWSDGSARERQGDLVTLTWGVGVLGSSALHAVHKNAALGFVALSTRLALPPLGGVLGIAGNCLANSDDPCSGDGARWGFAVGVGSAALLDAFLFARARAVIDPIEGDSSSRPRAWYGWQTMIVDGAALATGIGIAAAQQDPSRAETGTALFIVPYLAGFTLAPWVHAFHGRIGLAFTSLGMRALGPPIGALGGLMGFCAASGSDPHCVQEGAVYGIFFGTLAAAAIDAGVLAFERAPEPQARQTIVPFIAPLRGGATIGVAGQI